MYILIICNNPCSTWCYSTINKRSVSCVSRRNTSTARAAELFYILCSNTFHKDTWPANEKGKCFIKPRKRRKKNPAVWNMHVGGGGKKKQNRMNVLQPEKHLRDLRRWQRESRGSEQICLWRRAFRQSEFLKHIKKEKKIHTTQWRPSLVTAGKKKSITTERILNEMREKKKKSVPQMTEIIWTFFWFVCLFSV